MNAKSTESKAAHLGAKRIPIADLVPPEQIAVLNGFDGDDPADVLQIGALPVLNTPMQIAIENNVDRYSLAIDTLARLPHLQERGKDACFVLKP